MGPAVYEDGISSPRTHGVHGTKLPPARVVSVHNHKDEGYHDHAVTLLFVAWGQFMDHDNTLTAMPLGKFRKWNSLKNYSVSKEVEK